MSLKKDYDPNSPVNVDGHGTFTIEDYVKRIYEVPDSWTDNNLAVLKAQAVAARTYALNKMQRVGSICTTEACQVFKPEPKGGNWEQAVNATAGWVLMDGGNPGFTEYASTHGGYVLNIGKFDGRDGNPGSWSELNDRAYDKDSPWFYCDWGARSEYSNTAWLKSEEVADIVNTLALVKRDSGTAENLYQTDKPNPAGKETWSADKVKSELKNRGGSPIDSVSDISVSPDFGSGKSSSITINGTSYSANEFKDRFNLRAPANLQIVGPLFNVEKK
jgi:peptidoglycan hydrolase-like amidase